MSNKRLNAVITIGGAITSSLKSALGKTQGGLRKIGSEIGKLKREQDKLGASMKKMGSLGSRELTQLQGRYDHLSGRIARARREQDRLNRSYERQHRLGAIGGKLVGAGMRTGAGAVAIGAALAPGINEAKRYQAEMTRVRALGMGEKHNRQAAEFARGLKAYGVSETEKLTLVRDAMSVFGDVHHATMVTPTLAKMKFANAAVFGSEHGAENEAKFLDMLKVIELRGGTKSQGAFNNQANMVQRVISATGGRVGPDEWRHLISTGGLAAKSMRDDAFYYQLEPLVQEMGGDRVGTGLMSGYSALYQGRTTKRAAQNLDKLGLIGDKSKVEYDKSGQTAHLNVGAVKGAQLFRQSQYEWMKQVLLPTLAEKGITSKDEVLDAIGSVYSSRKGADLMAAMYLQKLQIDKNERVNRGAADIDTLDKQARGSTAGKEIDAQKKLDDAKLRMGTAILPAYTKALELAAGALEKFNAFADKNPKLVTAMAVGLAAIGGALAIIAPVLVTVGGGFFAVSGAVAAWGAIGPAVGATFAIIASGLGYLASGLLVVGEALLLNPIGLTIAGIAVAGLLIYKYWGSIEPFFINLWNSITKYAAVAWEYIKGNWLSFSPLGLIVKNWGPITSFFSSLWDDVTATARGALEWIINKISALGGVWKKTKEFFGVGSGETPGQGAPGGRPQPPKAPPMANGRGVTIHDKSTAHFTVVQQPGQDGKALAKDAAQAWGKERRAKGGSGSQLYDAPRGY